MQKHPNSEIPARPLPAAGGVTSTEHLLLYTHDDTLTEALSSIVAAGSLTVVSDEATLANQLMSAEAGVVFLDAAVAQSQPGMAAQLVQRLHDQLPDLVLVVAGDGAAQTELAALVTEGTIYRFVHKPVSAQRVKLFVEAAWRKREGSSASGVYPALSMSQLLPIAPMPRTVPWSGIATGAAVIGAAIAWFTLQSRAPVTEPLPKSEPPPTAQNSPHVSEAVVPDVPPRVTKVIDIERLDAAAEQALRSGDLGLAARLIEQARAADPDQARIRRLDAQLLHEQVRSDTRRRLAAAEQANSAAVERTLAKGSVPALVLTPAVPNIQLPVAASAAAAATPAAAVPEIASSPALLSPPTSTPPASEARDRLSVAAVILQRVSAVDPEFPEIAREQDLSGFVDLEFMVHTDGTVSDVTVLKSAPAGVFERSAVAAVRQWRYRPIERDGVPVAGHARLRLNFGYK